LACQDHHITLIEVPYWWDFKKESLMATIGQVRPELVPFRQDNLSIPLSPPKKEEEESKS
jgi:hypothetical protein